MQAQQNNIVGEYYLSGVMETASGIKLDADSTFQFFFSYGALDRSGSGRWSIKNNSLVLNSSKSYPGRDFKLTDSSTDNNNFITLKIEDPNQNVLRYVHCLAVIKDSVTIFDADHDGIIILPNRSVESFQLISEFSPERSSPFTVDNKKFNVFTFHFEPWTMEVFLHDFTLQLNNGNLKGTHPLLKEGTYNYLKN